MGSFGNFETHVQSWYILCSSKEVPKSQPRSFDFLDRRLVAVRDAQGQLSVFDAQCPHMGADLGHGDCVPSGLRCALHHWTFDAQGKPLTKSSHDSSPTFALKRYPCTERWGTVFVFNGPTALFPLPGPEDLSKYRTIAFPMGFANCHPHVATANGLDASHFAHLHSMIESSAHSVEKSSPYSVTLHINQRPISRRARWLTGSRKADIATVFSGVGGNIASSHNTSPHPYYLLICNTPSTAKKSTLSKTFLFVPKGTSLLAYFQIFMTLHHVFKDDRRILAGFKMHKGAMTSDRCVDLFIETVDAMPTHGADQR
jgi:nitrite reductase/ring-hydroxylating ferredoxin subunit